jgi:carbon storage regulator
MSRLVVARHEGERIVINNDIIITLFDLDSKTVRVLVDAPRNVTVHRYEVWKRINGVKVGEDTGMKEP